ncbi:hypothetical protein [Microvirga arabica]|uniref:hypothetical protein n=1 Tax=Microvirga arabica TaxID=1128671 RepID=UPI00193A324F|nr:hypothetical protein [Microvirga arabica]MBM1170607.1 hypothetical protein [Microvirga arabica]
MSYLEGHIWSSASTELSEQSTGNLFPEIAWRKILMSAPDVDFFDTDDLGGWMQSLIQQRPPAPAPTVFKGNKRERFWPAPETPAPQPGVKIISRHPALYEPFLDYPEMKIGRSPRGCQRGRQSRFPSIKSKRVMRAASSLEFDNMLDCELDPARHGFVEQPIWLRYILDGKVQRHRPDAFVIWEGYPEFQEVKFEIEASERENELRWEAIASALNGLGFGYRVRTENQVRCLPRYDTVWQVYEDRMTPLPNRAALIALTEKLSRTKPVTLGMIVADLGVSTDQIHALIRRGFLAINLNLPLGTNIPVSLGWTNLDGLTLLG